MARLFSWKPALTYRGRKFKGLRGWAGKPLHPPLTDVPVTCYFLVGLFDLISFIKGEGNRTGTDFYRAATYVLIAGAIVSVSTALTGFWDWWKGLPRNPGGFLGVATHSQVWRTVNVHMAIMLTVTALVIIDIILRLAYWSDGYAEPGVLILSLLILVLTSLGAFYGGSLVYEYGFNVENASDIPQYHESEQDIYPGGH
jgi:uncharacterized membrane protein